MGQILLHLVATGIMNERGLQPVSRAWEIGGNKSKCKVQVDIWIRFPIRIPYGKWGEFTLIQKHHTKFGVWNPRCIQNRKTNYFREKHRKLLAECNNVLLGINTEVHDCVRATAEAEWLWAKYEIIMAQTEQNIVHESHCESQSVGEWLRRYHRLHRTALVPALSLLWLGFIKTHDKQNPW